MNEFNEVEFYFCQYVQFMYLEFMTGRNKSKGKFTKFTDAFIVCTII